MDGQKQPQTPFGSGLEVRAKTLDDIPGNRVAYRRVLRARKMSMLAPPLSCRYPCGQRALGGVFMTTAFGHLLAAMNVIALIWRSIVS